MFGVGPQEIMIVGLLSLIVFGPEKLTGVARDLGRFVGAARRYKDELLPGSELVSGVDEAREREAS